MQEFIDKTATNNGTPLNRKTMMAIQGFEEKTTRVLENGDIVETNSSGHTKTTSLNNDGSITVIFIGEKTITKTIKLNSDGSITEVIS